MPFGIRCCRTAALCLIALTAPAGATGAGPAAPAVENFGRFQPVPGAKEQPDPTVSYRLVFNITKAASTADKVNPSLERVARFLNAVAHYGIRPEAGDIVAIAHGPATSAVLNDKAHRARRSGTPNPNLALISALRKAGVSVRVCGQALAAQKLRVAEVEEGVQVDVGAIVTIANLKARGYELIPD